MHRVIAIVGGALALAACSSNSSDWLSLDALKPKPIVESVRFESEPPGAEAKISNGQTCRTPCALALAHPESGGYSVTFSLNGYEPRTENIDMITAGDNSTKFGPNPIAVQLTPAPPPQKPKKKSVRRKITAKPAPTPKPAAASPPAPAPAAPQPAPSPWPAPAQPQQ
jgi:hypothetical protein